jgi:hypothetical protein
MKEPTMMKTALVATLFLSSIAILAVAPASAQVYGPDLDLTASSWENITGWFGNIVPLNNDASGNLYLDFPVDNPQCKAHCDTINYLYTRHVPVDITGGSLVVKLKVDTLTGSPVFKHTGWKDPCPNPPTVRPFIWAHNNSFNDGDRWWAVATAVDLQAALTQGEFTLSVPINPANFSGVTGHMASEGGIYTTQWNAAITNVSSIGVTFGGGCSFGHGVYTQQGTGAARFTLENYDAAPPCPAVTPCAGVNCVSSSAISLTSTGLDQCLTSAGVFINCENNQTVNVITAYCTSAPCCFNAHPCVCSACGGTGEYLGCQ